MPDRPNFTAKVASTVSPSCGAMKYTSAVSGAEDFSIAKAGATPTDKPNESSSTQVARAARKKRKIGKTIRVKLKSVTMVPLTQPM